MDNIITSWTDACKIFHTTKLRFINLTNVEVIITIAIAGITYGQGSLAASDSFSQSLLATLDIECSHAFYDVDIVPVSLVTSQSGVFPAARITAAGGSIVLVKYSHMKKEFELVDLGRSKDSMLLSDSIIIGTYQGILFEPVDASSFFDDDNLERVKNQREKERNKGYMLLMSLTSQESFDDEGNVIRKDKNKESSSATTASNLELPPGVPRLAIAKGRYDR